MRRLGAGRKLLIAIPLLWLGLFFLAPFATIVKISFAQSQLAIPPFSELITLDQEQLTITLELSNYTELYGYDLYLRSYLNSLRIALVSTVLCLLLGYPMAYAIVRLPRHWRTFCLMLVIMPSWTSFLIRIYAWMGILKGDGFLNSVLLALGVIDEPLVLLHTSTAVYIGIVYGYLPFMVLPIYANLAGQQRVLLEAGADLGAPPWQRFLRLTLPLSLPGVIAGSMLVFIPAVGEFIIPELLGGSDSLMIGKLLWSEFFNARNWPGAAALAVVMLLLLLIPITLFNRFERSRLGRHGI
jgi:putrescine transport system permease protein